MRSTKPGATASSMRFYKASIASVSLPGYLKPASLTYMGLPHKISTLLYCFNERDEVLLLERAQEPNRGLWSPCGGKLHTDEGESPYACACREAQEEMGIVLQPQDLHLTGLVSEHGYLGQAHWLMFLFEVKTRLTALPPLHREGRFEFFRREAMEALKLPQSDQEFIWPLFWQHRGGFFSVHCRCHPDGRNEWTLEESKVPRPDLLSVAGAAGSRVATLSPQDAL